MSNPGDSAWRIALRNPTFRARIAPKVRRVAGCWIWTACRTTKGYGKLEVMGISWRAHRYVYALLKSAVLPTLDLDHQCRNRACVRPCHLVVMSHEAHSVESNRVRWKRQKQSPAALDEGASRAG